MFPKNCLDNGVLLNRAKTPDDALLNSYRNNMHAPGKNAGLLSILTYNKTFIGEQEEERR